MIRREPDPQLRRFERSAAWCCVTTAAVAMVARRGHPDVALGILGGGLLIGTSYWAIRSGVDGLLSALATRAAADREASGPGTAVSSRLGGARFLLRFAGRYALLALLAYAIIARFRLHPVGVLIGVSSVVVAASLEAILTLHGRRDTARQQPSATPRSSPKV